LVYSKRVHISTSRSDDLVNITREVEKAVDESGVAEGIALVFTVHTTTGLFINEAESGLLEDVEKSLDRVVPPMEPYLHNRVDNNAASHIQSIFLGSSLAIPVEKGTLVLGTWQDVFLAERDGPRKRSVYVKVVGE
jgi:secondary thiamine-phosphate synthase enzyme